MADPLLEARGLTVRFGEKTVFEGLDLHVVEGEILFLMGGSGCGKTTVLKCLAGLLDPTEGEVLFKGEKLDGKGKRKLREVAGYVFQGSALLNSITLEENIALPMRARLKMPRHITREAVRMKLAQVGLLEAIDRRPAQLSGGMRKRAGIARALALDPTVLMMDEPTAGLDPVTADEIDTLTEEMHSALGATVIVVSHDLESAERLADRVVIMGGGHVLAEGSWDEVQESEEAEVRAFLDREGQRGEHDDPDWEAA